MKSMWHYHKEVSVTSVHAKTVEQCERMIINKNESNIARKKIRGKLQEAVSWDIFTNKNFVQIYFSNSDFAVWCMHFICFIVYFLGNYKIIFSSALQCDNSRHEINQVHKGRKVIILLHI